MSKKKGKKKGKKEYTNKEVEALRRSYIFLYSNYPKEEVTIYIGEVESLFSILHWSFFKSTREVEKAYLYYFSKE